MMKKFLQAEIRSVNKDAGTFEVIASSGKVDRLGDTIDPKGWYLKNYKKNPVILWSHSTGGMFGGVAVPPVARAAKVWVEDGKELKIKGVWADTRFAQELRTLVEGGFLSAVSVGFLPLVEKEKGNIEIEGKMYRRATDEEITKGIYDNDRGEKFIKQELLELSWVSVPALPQALVTARKMNLALVTKALEKKIKENPAKEEKEKEKEIEEKTEIEKETDVYEKPYPNEHSCRLENPDKYKRFRRKNCESKHEGKCIDVIYGVTKGEEEKAERQALRYDKEVWTEASAKSHCKDQKGTFEPASKKKELTADQFDTIKKFISETEKAMDALKELLPEIGITPADDAKGRILEKKIKSQAEKDREAEIKLLRLADKAIEALLRKLRRK